MAPANKLNDIKRHEIFALLACGASRNEAAEYVGCATTTIANSARRDPDFAERLRQAECCYALRNLRAINRAASRSWRAAAWALREHNPEVFGHNRVSAAAPASVARAAASDTAANESASPAGVPTSAGASSCGRPPKTRRQPRSSSGRFLPRTAAVPTFADPPDASHSDAPQFDPSSVAGPSPDDAFHALQQVVAAAGLSAEQQEQVLARFALLTVPGLAEQFPNLLADIAAQSAPSLRDGNPTDPSVCNRSQAADVGRKPPFNPPLSRGKHSQSPRHGNPTRPSAGNHPQAADVGRKPPSNTPSPTAFRPRKHAAVGLYVAAIVALFVFGLARESHPGALIRPSEPAAGQSRNRNLSVPTHFDQLLDHDIPSAALRQASIWTIADCESDPITGPISVFGRTARFKQETSESRLSPDCLPSGVDTAIK